MSAEMPKRRRTKTPSEVLLQKNRILRKLIPMTRDLTEKIKFYHADTEKMKAVSMPALIKISG